MLTPSSQAAVINSPVVEITEREINVNPIIIIKRQVSSRKFSQIKYLHWGFALICPDQNLQIFPVWHFISDTLILFHRVTLPWSLGRHWHARVRTRKHIQSLHRPHSQTECSHIQTHSIHKSPHSSNNVYTIPHPFSSTGLYAMPHKAHTPLQLIF